MALLRIYSTGKTGLVFAPFQLILRDPNSTTPPWGPGLKPIALIPIVLQCVAVCYRVLQCVAGCCSAWQFVAVAYSTKQPWGPGVKPIDLMPIALSML